MQIRLRRGIEPYAAHLVDGVTHPDHLVAAAVFELKNGARTADSMSVKMQQLVFLRMEQEGERDRYEDELRDEERKVKVDAVGRQR